MPFQSLMQRSFKKLKSWWSSAMTQTVPPEYAVCEFDCRKLSCSESEWQTCERRLHQVSQPISPDELVATVGKGHNG